MLEYLKEFGHCKIDPNESYECYLTDLDNKKYHYLSQLGKWLHGQKVLKLVFPVDSEQGLSSERESMLQALVDGGHMNWNTELTSPVVKTTSARNGMKGWVRHFAALRYYCQEHGHCNVPKRDSYECVLPGMGDNGEDYHYVGNLGRWLADQRQAKRGTHVSYKLTPERQTQLQQLVDDGKSR